MYPLIKAIAALDLKIAGEQESSLEATCTLVAVEPSQGLILHQLGLQVGEGGSLIVKKTPLRLNSTSAEF